VLLQEIYFDKNIYFWQYLPDENFLIFYLLFTNIVLS